YRELIAALLVFVATAAFCAAANIDVSDPTMRAVFERFALLPLAALAPFSACALAELWSLLRSRALATAVLGFALSAAAIVGVLQLPRLSLADAHGPRLLYRDVFAALAPHAILLTAGDAVDQSPEYFQTVEGQRTDVTVIPYGYLNDGRYLAALSRVVNVPSQVGLPLAPQLRRDLLAAANATRPFYVVGERPIHAPGPRYQPYVLGVVSQMIDERTRIDLQRHYRREVALMSVPGYADVPPLRRQSNGFARTVREYYAGGFFSAGFDAQRLGDKTAARAWYRRAQRYFPDPLIEQRIKML
ncbi:MAG TPA: hypothetical protein VNG31_10460, partial [Candidatus Baltobacteraceae bacterium]|nr:hypothetical protein [Candidatus Baltobacteraceae bacterium]